jgi:hypothetical protein
MDFPAAALWRDISAAFPNALVILSTRPANSWHRSAASKIFQLDTHRDSSPFQQVWNEWLGVTPAQFSDGDTMIAAYERHNASVRASAPAGRFLEWTIRDGWGPLCDALGVRVPDDTFP